MRSPHVDGQRGKSVVAYPHHLRAARLVVQDPVADGDVQSQDPDLCDELEVDHGVSQRILTRG